MRLAADTPVSRNTDKRVAGALALGVHALFVLLLVFGVSWQTEHPAPVMVDLWQSLPAETSPPRAVSPPDPVKPEPKPVPKPAPVPKPVAEEPSPKAPDIALEKKRAETERQKKLKAIQQAEEKAREASARAEADALKKVRDKQTEQKKQAMLRQMEADELKQSMVNEAAANAARAAKQAEAQAAGARQAALSQTIGKYRDLISATVRGNTRLPDNLKGNPQVRCLVKLLPTGDVVSVRVTQSSGNAAYDAAVVRAIEKSSPLPLPTEREARAAFVPELSFTHRPQE
ncbi:MAG: cell envelope integrity protein TolA [Thiobacillus sp.]|nr:cell envelope integrity protein TolA [Thiobacillus sp.]